MTYIKHVNLNQFYFSYSFLIKYLKFFYKIFSGINFTCKIKKIEFTFCLFVTSIILLQNRFKLLQILIK